MATNEQIGLLVTLFCPLLAGIFVLAFCRTERAIKIWSIRFSLVPLIVSAALLFAYDRTAGGIQFEIEAPWIPVLNSNFHLGADGLSMPLIFLTALLSTLSIFYSARTIRTRVREYFVMFHLLELSMLGVFVALDYVLFYLFWEVSLVPMYLLIGIWGGQNRSYASIKFFIYTLVGSVAMLLAILLTYFATGTFDIPGAAQAQAFAQLDDGTRLLLSSLAFWGFFLGFAFKVPSFPFHTWLPDAHTEAPTAGSVILAGVLLKLGAYGFLRIILPTYPEASQFWAPAVIAVGAIAIVYGAFVCVAQGDLKRLIAYSSVSHMGYVMLGIGAASLVLTPAGLEQVAAKFGGVAAADVYDSAAMALNGAALQMFNHGIITGALFLLVGVIYERAHTRDLTRFGGLSAKTPYFYGIMMVTAFASLGLPGLAGFWAEFFTFRGAFAIVPVWAAFGTIGIVMTAVYILWRILQNVFLGEYEPDKIERWTTVDGARAEGPTDMAVFEKITLWPLVILMVVLGVYPSWLISLFNVSSVELIEFIVNLA